MENNIGEGGKSVEPDMKIYVRDGDGNVRTVVASGRQACPRTTSFCKGHFIAHGICIDCTQAMGETVWAS